MPLANDLHYRTYFSVIYINIINNNVNKSGTNVSAVLFKIVEMGLRFYRFVFTDGLRIENDDRNLSALKRWIDLIWDVHYRREGGWPFAFFMFMQVIMLHIFFSPRFESVVMALWIRRDIFMDFYFQLYFYFVFAVTLVTCTFTPLPELLLPWLASWVSALGIVTRILGWINYVLYIFVANVVLYIFFKTNYRVSTIAEYEPLKRKLRFLVVVLDL